MPTWRTRARSRATHAQAFLAVTQRPRWLVPLGGPTASLPHVPTPDRGSFPYLLTYLLPHPGRSPRSYLSLPAPHNQSHFRRQSIAVSSGAVRPPAWNDTELYHAAATAPWIPPRGGPSRRSSYRPVHLRVLSPTAEACQCCLPSVCNLLTSHPSYYGILEHGHLSIPPQ